MCDLSHLAVGGSQIPVRVTPRAARNGIEVRDGVIRITVTAVPEDGKATEAVRRILADALGIAKTRLVLVRGQAARDKVFRVEP